MNTPSKIEEEKLGLYIMSHVCSSPMRGYTNTCFLDLIVDEMIIENWHHTNILCLTIVCVLIHQEIEGLCIHGLLFMHTWEHCIIH
jgi:hypothetical protein